MRFGLLLAFVSFIAIVCSSQQLQIIPQPVSVKTQPGKFAITKKTVIAARDEEDRKTAKLLNDYLQEVYGFKLDIDKQEGKNYIRFNTKKFIRAPDKDAYTLNVTSNGVTIEGDTYNGTFYGMQTLIQLMPVENVKPQTTNFKLDIPFVSIEDYPRFSWRGMHLDVARHFFPPSFVKKYIDYLALHKMNYFHWHLTDDQGWRIEIKKYPELTTKGAWRNGTIIGRFPGTGNDNIRYGGFYTQDEVRDIIAYAADRHITVIPEIEMPGHASAAIAAYPWLSCFPAQPTVVRSYPSVATQQQGGKQVQESWGVYDDVFCAGKDSTFSFLEGVLDEVIQLFPSNLVHVGGDECPKTNWKKCPNCQARMSSLGLKDEHELQSYFIQRMEKYLNSKGKTLIGWDEILEGGLAPNAVVMSWRGEAGGIAAAKLKHQVIMTPSTYIYFDYSQTRNEDSLVIGGFLPVDKIYNYEPLSKELDSSEAKYILGAQANLWTEYVAYPSKVEYMIFPRMTALSEVLWSPKEKRNWSDFEKRLQTQFKRYDLWHASYSKAYYEVKVSLVPAPGYNGVKIVAEPRDKIGKLDYEIIGTNYPKKYSTPLVINKSSNIGFNYYRNNQLTNRVDIHIDYNKATGKKLSLTSAPNEKYAGQGGAFSLVNGVYSRKGLSHPDWLGWIGDDMEATMDLGKLQKVDTVRIHTLDQNGSWIYLPQYVEVFTSTDGKTYTSVGRSSEFVSDTLTMGWITVSFPEKNTRFLKVIAKNYGMIGEGKAGEGNKSWLMVDELQVY